MKVLLLTAAAVAFMSAVIFVAAHTPVDCDGACMQAYLED